MKKVPFFLAFLLISIASFSQNTFPTSGNAGIGTTSPSANLHVRSYDYDKILMDVAGGNTAGAVQQKWSNSSKTMSIGLTGTTYTPATIFKTSIAYISTNANNGFFISSSGSSAPIRFYTAGEADANERFRINESGKLFAFNITAGTSIPDSALIIEPSTKEFQMTINRPGSIQLKDTRSTATSPSTYNNLLQVNYKTNTVVGLPNVGSGISAVIGMRTGVDNTTGKAQELAFTDNNSVYIRSGSTSGWESWRKLVIEDASGNVGIGTSTPQGKLAVNGTIYATKVKVTQTGWADYVFAPGYQLPGLQYLETYIQQNKHLPNVPSAAEVAKEGVDLGENQRVLLEKIEELTLYVIELNKKVARVEAENAALKKHSKK